jgi:hypothetical protein
MLHSRGLLFIVPAATSNPTEKFKIVMSTGKVIAAVCRDRHVAHRHGATGHKNQWVNLMCSADTFLHENILNVPGSVLRHENAQLYCAM